MRTRIAHDLAQFVDDGLGRRQVRIAHAEVDDVGAPRTGARLEPVDLLEHVRRKPADLVKFFHGSSRQRGSVGRALYTHLQVGSRAGSHLPSICFRVCGPCFLARSVSAAWLVTAAPPPLAPCLFASAFNWASLAFFSASVNCL